MWKSYKIINFRHFFKKILVNLLSNKKEETYKEENHPELKGKGLLGEALAILKDHRRNKITEQFFNFIKNNYDFNYLLGQEDKKLNNIDFCLKYRKILKETDKHIITYQELITEW